MSRRLIVRFGLLAGLATVLVQLAPHPAEAGCVRGFRNRGVGGVSIDADGVLVKNTREDRGAWLSVLKDYVKGSPAELTAPTEIRKVSLKRLEAAIRTSRGMVPEEAKYLGGLQRIQYVFVYPEENDIVLAGPGEGWRVDESGTVVGVTTGRPVLLLDDLLVALRTSGAARDESITCSIDPTDEGRARLTSYLKSVRSFTPAVVKRAEAAMGPQQITLTGVPTDSHFARVMVAADFHMKRIAMKLDPSPVKAVPSYLDLIKSTAGPTPRWWLACDYESISRSDDGLAWELRGRGVKAMTEDEYYEDGKISGTGRANPAAQKWSDLFTENYDKLSAANPVFGELRNIFDLSIVAAIIKKHDLAGRADCPLPHLIGEKEGVQLETWAAPKTVATQCSFMSSSRGVIFTASGGVEIDSWTIAEKAVVNEKIGEVRKTAAVGETDKWWWN